MYGNCNDGSLFNVNIAVDLVIPVYTVHTTHALCLSHKENRLEFGIQRIITKIKPIYLNYYTYILIYINKYNILSL